MSHLKERKEKNCLNCQADLVGRYCHRCGQENLEPKETVWHLVQHFFNDITHFDGKFFETVRYLLRRPGFLSTEYMLGRRASYLNPIRMYVFTSAIFFIILFSLKKPDDFVHVNDKEKKEVVLSLPDLKARLAREEKDLLRTRDMDDREDLEQSIQKTAAAIASIHKVYGDSTAKRFTRELIDDLAVDALADSLKRPGLTETQKAAYRDNINEITNPNSGMTLFGMNLGQYKNAAEYDSAQRILPDSLKDGWLTASIARQVITSHQEYREDPRRWKEHFWEHLTHNFPKILFWSLPIFAMILNILYFRHKKTYYYVDHGIFTIHLYCATFILLLLTVLIDKLTDWINIGWIKIVGGILIFGLIIYMLIYLYKAMRGFYKQGRAKTFVKYIITFWVAAIVNIILLTIFTLLSLISV